MLLGATWSGGKAKWLPSWRGGGATKPLGQGSLVWINPHRSIQLERRRGRRATGIIRPSERSDQNIYRETSNTPNIRGGTFLKQKGSLDMPRSFFTFLEQFSVLIKHLLPLGKWALSRLRGEWGHFHTTENKQDWWSDFLPDQIDKHIAWKERENKPATMYKLGVKSSLLRLGCCQALQNGKSTQRVLQKEEFLVRIKLGRSADRARNIDQATKVSWLPLVILFQGWTGGLLRTRRSKPLYGGWCVAFPLLWGSSLIPTLIWTLFHLRKPCWIW